MVAARGFVIDPNDEGVCSREQDILIVDTTAEGPVFHQGGVVRRSGREDVPRGLAFRESGVCGTMAVVAVSSRACHGWH